MQFRAANNSSTLGERTAHRADNRRSLATQKKAVTAAWAFYGSDLVRILMNPLTVIFLIAAIGSAVAGNPLDAAILSFIVIASATMDRSQGRVSTTPLQASPTYPIRHRAPSKCSAGSPLSHASATSPSQRTYGKATIRGLIAPNQTAPETE
jgi:hypothetical protein